MIAESDDKFVTHYMKWGNTDLISARFKFKKKKRPVLLIVSALLSQLSAGGIASRYNKSKDALILTVPAKYIDF